MNQYEAWLKGRGVKRNFRHVFTGFAKTAKRAIPLDSLRAIRQLRLPDGSAAAFARDMFMLIVYLQVSRSLTWLA